MINQIHIESKNLANYIMFKLDKIENNFTEDELNQITELVIDYEEEDESCFIFLQELLKLKNLKSLTLRNGYIYNDNYNIFLKLNNLHGITFENCEFENADLIASLELISLSLINCKINDYSFINIFEQLKELTVVNGKVKISKINLLKYLNYLQLSYSEIINDNELSIINLEELYIDNTNIDKFDFVNDIPNLKKISIDENQYNSNKDLFDSLSNKNVLVLNENMIEFFGGNES